MSQRRAALYLQIPAEYCRPFGGLRWAQYGEAVEFLDGPNAGRTFVFAAEIGQFLEGLLGASGGCCPAFGSVLQMLFVLGLGDRVNAGRPVGVYRINRLARPFAEQGRPLRNAGALLAELLRQPPGDTLGVPDPPTLADLVDLLNGGRWIPQMVLSHPMLGAMDYAEQPSLSQTALHELVSSAIDPMSDPMIRHWLTYGRGPLARVDAPTIPLPTIGLAEALVRVEERPRLTGLTRLVSRLDGALSLPPRRLDDEGLRVDGYWDLATRGAPERILPFQFAMEDDEFIRRFAAEELLYFHRERPARPIVQEMVLLLDQGVRTWGDVRLALAGAAMALTRQAVRRKSGVRLLTTSMRGEPADPTLMSPDELGSILEASDLTPNPSRALVGLIRDKTDAPHDVVLLTHPRSLTDPEVIEASQRIESPQSMRILAVTINDRGCVELSEVRRGHPMVLSRCRVDLSDPTVVSAPEPMPGLREPRRPWRGPVEAIPFSFRCGLLAPLSRVSEMGTRLIDFDASGERVLAVLRPGMLYSVRIDGSDVEILPRPMVDGRVLKPIRTVIGVAGGFVVEGRRQGHPILFHYDFPTRTCAEYTFPGIAKDLLPVTWFYYPDLHSLGGRPNRVGEPSFGVDLSVSEGFGAFSGATARASRAAERAQAVGWPRLSIEVSDTWTDTTCHDVELDPESGTLTYRRGGDPPRSLTPKIDGSPALERGSIVSTHQGDDVLAVQTLSNRSGLTLWFIAISDALVIEAFLPEHRRADSGMFALTRDGRRFAYRQGNEGLAISDVPGGRPPVAVIPCESMRSIEAIPGQSRLLVRQDAPNNPHATSRVLIRWDAGRLIVAHDDEIPKSALVSVESPRSAWRHWPPYDPDRFAPSFERNGLRFLVDRYQQVAIRDRANQLVAMFFIAGREFAAWMPDGTSFGSRRLIGGEETPGAAERIAAALRAAESVEENAP